MVGGGVGGLHCTHTHIHAASAEYVVKHVLFLCFAVLAASDVVELTVQRGSNRMQRPSPSTNSIAPMTPVAQRNSITAPQPVDVSSSRGEGGRLWQQLHSQTYTPGHSPAQSSQAVFWQFDTGRVRKSKRECVSVSEVVRVGFNVIKNNIEFVSWEQKLRAHVTSSRDDRDDSTCKLWSLRMKCQNIAFTFCHKCIVKCWLNMRILPLF